MTVRVEPPACCLMGMPARTSGRAMMRSELHLPRSRSDGSEPDPELVECVAQIGWHALKERVCSDPPNAVRCVMVSKADFNHAIRTALSAADRWRRERMEEKR